METGPILFDTPPSSPTRRLHKPQPPSKSYSTSEKVGQGGSLRALWRNQQYVASRNALASLYSGVVGPPFWWSASLQSSSPFFAPL